MLVLYTNYHCCYNNNNRIIAAVLQFPDIIFDIALIAGRNFRDPNTCGEEGLQRDSKVK